MSFTRLLITSVVIENRTARDVAAQYGVSESWLFELLARYKADGEAAFEPRSRRPQSSPTAIPAEAVDLIVEYREKPTATGLDAGPDTIAWHLTHHHGVTVSRATIARYLAKHGLVVPEPKKKPKSSHIRFQAAMPNETWQADFTHYRLTRPDGRPGADCEILTRLDDRSRFALSVTVHHRVTGTIVRATLPSNRCRARDSGLNADRQRHGVHHPAVPGPEGCRHPQRVRDRAPTLGIVQKNSTPGHPTTCGKVERFQQTMKKWLRGPPEQPTTIDDLQALVDAFVEEYNDHRPHRSLEHRSLEHRATPATVYTTRPKAAPTTGDRDQDTHHRVRHDKVDKAGKITWRYQGEMYSIGIGRTHTGTRVIVLAQDLEIRVIDAATGELLRELALDTSKRYQGTGRPPGPTR